MFLVAPDIVFPEAPHPPSGLVALDVAASSLTPDGFLAQVEIAGDAGDGPQAIFGWGGPSFPFWLGFGEFKGVDRALYPGLH